MTRISKWIALAALVAVTGLGAGCTGTDTLSTGNVTLSFSTTTTNPTATDYACVLLSVSKLFVRIYDGTCSNDGAFCGRDGDCTGGGTCEGATADEVIAANGFNIISDPGVFALNFTNQGQACAPVGTPASNIDTTSLSSNRYRIVRLEIEQPTLVRQDGSFLICDGYLQEVAPAFPEDTFFLLGDSQSNIVTLVINIAEIESLFDSNGFCDPGEVAMDVTNWFAIQ